MCRICELNEQGDGLPAYERLYVGEHWRVAHAWSSLPGWLVVGLRRHAAGLDELTAEEAESLGRLLRAASIALKQAVGCEKTYVMLFAEQELFAHVHLHVVPRMSWFGPDERAAGAFRFLNVPPDEQVSVAERERLAQELGGVIVAELEH